MLYNDPATRRLLVDERLAQLRRDATHVTATRADTDRPQWPKPLALRRIVVFAVLVVVAAVLALPAVAAQPQAVQLDLAGHITGPDSLAGTWSATGAIVDAGTYTETFRFVGDTVHVEKTLVGGNGTILLAARAVVAWITPCTATFTAGSWRIAGGSGAYSSLVGGGAPAATTQSYADVCTGGIRIRHVGTAH